MGNRVFTAPLVASLVAIAGCGGGGGDGGTSVAGIDRLGASTGTVTGFGSIFVNGVEFETGRASFIIDDSPGRESDLRVGQVVTVIGTIDDNGTTGEAQTVIFDDSVEGPIASIDRAGGQLVVLGQAVVVDGNTSFDDDIVPGSLEGLAVGDFVEISGFLDAAGTVRATRIEKVSAGDELEVRGRVESLDTQNRTFVINGLTVDYRAAVLDDSFNGVISNGDFVEAKGDSLGTNGELIATEVELEDDALVEFEVDGEVEVEGFVTRFASATNFDVAGIRVSTTSATEYDDGTAADLAVNVKLEVEGRLNANGVLVAEEVKFRSGSGSGGSGDSSGSRDAELFATVDSVNAAAGTLVALGITISVDSLTRIEDKSDADVRPFSLANLRTGDYVEVRGLARSDGTVGATLLEREDPEPDTILRGPVGTAGTQTLTVLGVTIETSAATQYRDVNDSPISASAFFAAVSAGDEVKARGTEVTATSLLAEELELEN